MDFLYWLLLLIPNLGFGLECSFKDFDVICFGCHAPDETHKVETLRFVVHYFALLFAGILHWLC